MASMALQPDWIFWTHIQSENQKSMD